MMPIVRTPIGQIETVTRGESGQLFVMVHAAGAGPHAFDRLTHLLGTAQRQFIAPARIGYGTTTLDADGDIVARNVALIEALMADLASDDIVLFGHSMGGLISLLTAMNCAGHRRQNIKAIILYDPILVTLLRTVMDNERAALEWDRGIVASLKDRVTAGEPEDGVRTFIEAWSGQRWTDLPDPVRAQFVSLAGTLLEETSATSYYQLDQEQLRSIDVPVLLLVGEQSPAMVHLMAKRAAELIPYASVAFIEGADHMGPMNNPKLIVPAIERYLERLS